MWWVCAPLPSNWGYKVSNSEWWVYQYPEFEYQNPCNQKALISPTSVIRTLLESLEPSDSFWTKRVPADAHDAGVPGCHRPSVVQLMLMMLGFRGAMDQARSS